MVGGSVGCIEIADGEWKSFQNELESLAGGTSAHIGASRKLMVVIEPAPYPTAVSFRSWRMPSRAAPAPVSTKSLAPKFGAVQRQGSATT